MTKEYTTSIKRMTTTRRQRMRQREPKQVSFFMEYDLWVFLSKYALTHKKPKAVLLRRLIRGLRHEEETKQREVLRQQAALLMNEN